MDENTRWQKLAAEFLGTAFLVFVGVGSVPALLIVNEANGSTFSGSDLGIISLAFATIVIVTVYVFGYICGNHINPAVTFGLAATGKFPWAEVPATSRPRSPAPSPAPSPSWACWAAKASDMGLGVASYGDAIPWYQAFFAEFVGTFLLVFAVFGVIYRKAAPGWAGLAIGMVVFAAIIPVAPTTGASINPARTTGPMLVQQILGGDVSWEQWPVYVGAELLAGVLRPLAFGIIAHTQDGAEAQRRSGRRRACGGLTMKKLINVPRTSWPTPSRGSRPPTPTSGSTTSTASSTAPQPKAAGKVALISGGGSGHEPLHGGFVGPGMLDAACCGEVFTSPTPDQMAEATTVVDRGAGVLHIVKNYTGDVMNFEMAGEMAAADSGVRVETVVTDDDVAVQDSTWTAGRRGVGVTVLLEKIVGAAAEEGRDLDAVLALAKRVNGQGRSMGMALTSCTVPAAGKPTFDLPEDEMEMGVGIHGEPGRHRVPLARRGRDRRAARRAGPRRPRLHRRPEHRDAQRAWAARR